MVMQTHTPRATLLAVLLLMSLILTVSAACHETSLDVPLSDVRIETPGTLTPGTGVVMSARINFPDKENTTYPATSQLELTSGLDAPAWTWNIVRNGVKRPEIEDRKSRVVISGGELAYPANTSVSLEIKLYGTTPSVMENKKLTVMRIQDIAGTDCIGEVYRYNAWVLNTTNTKERIRILYREIDLLKADSDVKNRTGADTSRIMEKIVDAQQNLDRANNTPELEYVSIALAINRTESSLDEGRHLLKSLGVPGTTIPQQGEAVMQKEVPGTPQKTPASPEPAPVLIVASLGVAVLIRFARH